MNYRMYLALSFFLLATLSAGAARADDAADPRISKAEQLLLGKISADQSLETRLDTIEMSLYGKTKHGSVSKRLDAISDFLGVKSDDSAAPEDSKESVSKDVAPHDASMNEVSKAVEPKREATEAAPKGVAGSSNESYLKTASKTEAPSKSSQARDLLREGMRQFSNGRYNDAEETFRRVLTVDPRNADAFYNLGSLAERRHDYVVALTNYRAALNFNPTDKDYITAVDAMEHQLSASPASSAAPLHATKTATVGHFRVPVDAATAGAPLVDVGSPIGGGVNGQPFQLSGTKNDLIMNTTQFTNNYAPTMSVSQPFAGRMSVNQPGPPPTMGVAQQPPKNGSGFGKVLNVGMRAALYSSGLHCPICRMMGGGFHF